MITIDREAVTPLMARLEQEHSLETCIALGEAYGVDLVNDESMSASR